MVSIRHQNKRKTKMNDDKIQDTAPHAQQVQSRKCVRCIDDYNNEAAPEWTAVRISNPHRSNTRNRMNTKKYYKFLGSARKSEEIQ